MRVIRRVQDLNLKGRRVFLRVDFNVPLKTVNGEIAVADEKRIVAALPTIQFILEKEAKLILASHLGRPDGKPLAKYSLEPVGKRLSELLKRDVILADDCIGDGARGLSQQIRSGEILLLENLRFHPGEEENAPEFANRLLELCDVYVSDAFGTLHRAHASTAGLPKLVSERGIGLLVQKELEYLEPLRDHPEAPFALVVGGSKVSDKIGVLDHLMPKLNRVFVGGAMAYAFLAAQGRKIGKSLCEDRQVALAARILKSAEARHVRVYLPIDHTVSGDWKTAEGKLVTDGPDIPADKMGVDIGPGTIALYREELQPAKTIFWNGPLGVVEVPEFAVGTNAIAKAIAESSARKLAGGGDVAAAIGASGFESKFDFISTGGGATLEYLEGKELPGLKALEVLDKSGKAGGKKEGEAGDR